MQAPVIDMKHLYKAKGCIDHNVVTITSKTAIRILQVIKKRNINLRTIHLQILYEDFINGPKFYHSLKKTTFNDDEKLKYKRQKEKSYWTDFARHSSVL